MSHILHFSYVLLNEYILSFNAFNEIINQTNLHEYLLLEKNN